MKSSVFQEEEEHPYEYQPHLRGHQSTQNAKKTMIGILGLLKDRSGELVARVVPEIAEGRCDVTAVLLTRSLKKPGVGVVDIGGSKTL